MAVEVSAQTIANEFLRFANDDGKALTNMQLQKLVFLGQGYTLALLDRPAYYNNTHAWQWGPVVPKLYKDLQKYGSGQVSDAIPVAVDESADAAVVGVLKAVWRAYGGKTGSQLSEITHRPGTPWSKTWADSKFGVIPIQEIKAYYSNLTHRG
jgi:uncharacterized phage-associated protein